MEILTWIIVGAVILTPAVLLFVMPSEANAMSRNRKPKALLARSPAARLWAEAGIGSATVDQLLDRLGDDFDLTRVALERARPDDTLAGLYQMVYPKPAVCDQMEGVCFLMGIEEASGREFSDDDEPYAMPLLAFAEMLDHP